MALLAACSPANRESRPETRSLATELPPAALPTHAKGDSLTYNNPEETWTVLGVRADLVSWRSSLGGTQKRLFDPLLPPVAWDNPGATDGSRKLLEWSGSLFPLKAGNKLTFKTAVRLPARSGERVFVWNCYAGNPRMITVPAGDFAAFPVLCRRNDGRKVQTYYAPAVNASVSIKTTTRKGGKRLRQLTAMKVGAGARISAQRHESLPGGWSSAAIAEWRSSSVRARRSRPPAARQIGPARAAATLAGTGATTRMKTSDKRPPPTDNRLSRRTALNTLPAGKAARAAKSSNSGVEKQLFAAHLGSFSTSARAQRAWRVYGTMHKSILAKRNHAVYPVDLGMPKGMLYRLVATPMGTRGKIAALCRAIRQQNGYCRVIPAER